MALTAAVTFPPRKEQQMDDWIWNSDHNTVETEEGWPVAFIPDAWPEEEQDRLGSLIAKAPAMKAEVETLRAKRERHHLLNKALTGDTVAGLAIYDKIAAACRWSGSPWTHGDAETILQACLDDDEATLTPEEWATVTASEEWRALGECRESEWDAIRRVVSRLPRVEAAVMAAGEETP